MKNSLKRFGLIDIGLGRIVILAITFLFGAVILYTMLKGFVGGSCEELMRADIRSLIVKAQQAELSGGEESKIFRVGNCVERISASTNNKLLIRFAGQTSEESFSQGVKFFVDRGDGKNDQAIRESGNYKVTISNNKVNIITPKIS